MSIQGGSGGFDQGLGTPGHTGSQELLSFHGGRRTERDWPSAPPVPDRQPGRPQAVEDPRKDAPVDVQHRLDQIRRAIENAKSVPMSASCIVNRKELLAGLAEVQRMLPAEFAEAKAIVEQRQAAIEAGRKEAERLVEAARRECQAVVYNTDIYREARRSADELLAQAQAEAEGLRREVDDYVDHKLAGLEIALQKTLAAVADGRQRLRGRAPGGRRGEVPLTPREADEYVDHKLSRFEYSLHKTLEAVTRGRERLRDRSNLDTYTADDDAPPLPT